MSGVFPALLVEANLRKFKYLTNFWSASLFLIFFCLNLRGTQTEVWFIEGISLGCGIYF